MIGMTVNGEENAACHGIADLHRSLGSSTGQVPAVRGPGYREHIRSILIAQERRSQWARKGEMRNAHRGVGNRASCQQRDEPAEGKEPPGDMCTHERAPSSSHTAL